uniref:LigA n=1 Tax=Parastrongyloides trichosuri TaxID=131310 RepID=A0A0N4Z5J3_PARTI
MTGRSVVGSVIPRHDGKARQTRLVGQDAGQGVDLQRHGAARLDVLFVDLAVGADDMADARGAEPVLGQQGAQRLFFRRRAARPAQGDVQHADVRQARVEEAQNGQHQQGRPRRDQPQLPQTDAEHHPDGRGGPQRRRRGQAVHREPLAEDHPGAQEADAGQDAVRHPRRVDHQTLLRQGDEPPAGLVHGRQHEHARRHADQDVGAEPRRMAVVGPLAPRTARGRSPRRTGSRCRSVCRAPSASGRSPAAARAGRRSPSWPDAWPPASGRRRSCRPGCGCGTPQGGRDRSARSRSARPPPWPRPPAPAGSVPRRPNALDLRAGRGKPSVVARVQRIAADGRQGRQPRRQGLERRLALGMDAPAATHHGAVVDQFETVGRGPGVDRAQGGFDLGLGRGAVASPAHLHIGQGAVGQARIDQPQRDQDQARDHRPRRTQGEQPRPEQQADGRGDPQRGRRRQAVDGEAGAEDDPGAQEADPRQHPVGHAGRVSDDVLVRQGAKGPVGLGHGRQHQQAGRQADQDVGAEPRRPAPPFALKPDHPAGYQGPRDR